MDMVIEGYSFNEKTNNGIFSRTVLYSFLRVMKTLDEGEEFCLLVTQNFTANNLADFSFMVNNSENLAGGSTNANEDVCMDVYYERVLFLNKEKRNPFIKKSHLKVDLRVEKDGELDASSRRTMYERLAEAFYEIVSQNDNFIGLEAFYGDEKIWKK